MEWGEVFSKVVDHSGYTVTLKTNITPEITVYDPVAAGGDSVFSGLFAAGVTLKDASGKVIANYGGYPQTNYPLAIALYSLAAFGAVILVRGIVK